MRSTIIATQPLGAPTMSPHDEAPTLPLCYTPCMQRLYGWDYRRPYFYMVTLSCRQGRQPLSHLDTKAPWGIAEAPLTRALADELASILVDYPGIESFAPYVIMPDHLHLLIKLRGDLSLPRVVRILMVRLSAVYTAQTGDAHLLFEKAWHDWIVTTPKMLPNFCHYIRANPKMRLLRQSSPDLFRCWRGIKPWRLNRAPCDAVGNLELLNAPILEAVRVSRSVKPGTPQWESTLAPFRKWRHGMTAVGTWFSPGEQAVRELILARGGNLIVLKPHGIPERWHPEGEAAQYLCAEGRCLYLTPYAPQTQMLPQGETRSRCLALNALAQQMAAEIVLRTTPTTKRGGAQL